MPGCRQQSVNRCVAVSKPNTGRGKWGVRYSAYGLPGFAIVLCGQGWLEIDGNAPVQLDRGDFVLLPSTPAFALFSQPGADRVYRDPTDTDVRHGEQEGEPDFRMLERIPRTDPRSPPQGSGTGPPQRGDVQAVDSAASLDPLHRRRFADAAVSIRRCANVDDIAARAGGAGILDGTRPHARSSIEASETHRASEANSDYLRCSTSRRADHGVR